ncbi:hypothetical protein JR316_0006102 [Psilocybe cubensis]|uniref:Wax synthase domain-containing protein n=2 Tax=Psilocybe cubensis TaxID=181762 RepID=A0A8H8CL01_PSICU|nr:hypothetical protein JR316_0006102 [Psilocybe cubensis]KAH9481575.1 hypothetical protein JR316_0006102 [Psilocybe cubensis]
MALSSMSAWIPDPASRQPLTVHTFTQDILPPILFYYLTGLLVLIPRTYPIRLALLPITLYTTFKASTQIDLAKGYAEEPSLVYMNQGLLLAMITLGIRATIWTFQLEPYKRAKSNGLILDSFDLFFSLRGIGWSWSTGLKVTKDSRNTAHPPSFILSSLLSLLFHYHLFDFLLFSVQSFGDLSNPLGASIFDPALPAPLRYLRSSFICFLAGLAVYHAIQLLYYTATLIGLVLLRQSPDQWPPLFDAPWFTTSLNLFWSLRWHQLFRHNFIAFGGYPGYILFGRLGGVAGAFLVSGLLHYWGLWGMGRGTDFYGAAGFFLMMGVGTVLEFAFKSVTGRKVRGFWGWMWSMLWVLGWGNILVEAWLVRGLAASKFQPQHTRPSLMVAELVKHNLRAWGYNTTI